MAAVEDKSVQQMQAAGARLLQNSPGLAEKLAAQGKGGGSRTALTTMGRADDRETMIQDLQRQLDAEKDKNRSLEDSYKFRVASFVKRETQTRNKIDSLERRLNDGPEADEHNTRMDVVRTMHKSVVNGLDCIQNNTAKILQDQEKDLMRAFRNRLQEVSKEHEVQKSRKGEHSSELQAKHRRVVGELYEAQELAQTFDKKNQQLQAENQRLQEKLRTREDDRQALLKELVMARKEVARLKAQCKEGAAAEGEGISRATAEESPIAQRKSFSQRQIEQARQQASFNKQYEREVGFRDAITKLKRMVEAERKVTRGLKQQQAESLQQRTELEVLLRQCLDDVKAEILRHRAQEGGSPASGIAGMNGSAQAISGMSVHELTAQDRERVLELLLSQQRVVQLLYSKTFAQHATSPLSAQEDEVSGAMVTKSGNQEDFSWLSNIIPQEDGDAGR